MKAKELAEQLLKNPDFDIVFNVVDNGGGFGFNIKQFVNVNIINVNYNNKTIICGGEDV